LGALVGWPLIWHTSGINGWAAPGWLTSALPSEKFSAATTDFPTAALLITERLGLSLRKILISGRRVVPGGFLVRQAVSCAATMLLVEMGRQKMLLDLTWFCGYDRGHLKRA